MMKNKRGQIQPLPQVTSEAVNTNTQEPTTNQPAQQQAANVTNANPQEPAKQQAPNINVVESTPKKSKWWLWLILIILAIIAIVVVAVVAFWFLGGEGVSDAGGSLLSGVGSSTPQPPSLPN